MEMKQLLERGNTERFDDDIQRIERTQNHGCMSGRKKKRKKDKRHKCDKDASESSSKKRKTRKKRKKMKTARDHDFSADGCLKQNLRNIWCPQRDLKALVSCIPPWCPVQNLNSRKLFPRNFVTMYIYLETIKKITKKNTIFYFDLRPKKKLDNKNKQNKKVYSV